MTRSRSTGSGAFELLLSAIDEGVLPAGTRLREAELAARFNISRTPVREALKRLEQLGVVTHEPHHGAVVTTLDYGQVVELYRMREVLEGSAAQMAATQATATEIELLHEMVEHDRRLSDDPEALAARNKLFHRQLQLAARNRFLNAMLDTLRLSMALLRGTTLGRPYRGMASIEEHAEIVAAIAARDPEAAEAAARRHIRNAFKARLQLEAPAED